MLTLFTQTVLNKGELDIHGTSVAYPMLLRPAVNTREEATPCLAFHLSLWLESQPTPVSFRAMVDIEVTAAPIERPVYRPLWVLFERKSDLRAYQKWFAKYSKWFGEADPTVTFYPPLPETGRHTFNFIKIAAGEIYDPMVDQMTVPTGSVDRWIWVLQNCRKPVYHLPKGVGLAFTSQTEAMHFKLRWC